MVRSLNVIGVPRGSKARAGGGGRAREGVISPLVRGVRGISPENFFEFNMSVEAVLMHFETIQFACKIRLIVRAFHVAVFKVFRTHITKD